MFYVYDLVDPRTGAIFYVGKGRGRRAWAHERAVRRQSSTMSNSDKCAVIQSIIDAGMTVEVRIVKEFDNEMDAYRAEKDRIEAIGIDNLTNAYVGGNGRKAGYSAPDTQGFILKVLWILHGKAADAFAAARDMKTYCGDKPVIRSFMAEMAREMLSTREKMRAVVDAVNPEKSRHWDVESLNRVKGILDKRAKDAA